MTRPVSVLLLAAALLAGSVPACAADGADNAGPPVPGKLRVFEDWAVGCDNRLGCMAVALKPDGGTPAYAVLLRVGREGGAEGVARLELLATTALRGRLDLVVDGMPVDAVDARDTIAPAGPEQAFRLVRLLGSSYALEIRQGGALLETPSLNGLAMALRYIDEQQGRVGSMSALAAIGDRPGDLARPIPPQAAIMVPAMARAPAELPDLGPAERASARRVAGCDGRKRTEPTITAHRLEASRALVLVRCDAGADNAPAVPLIATGRPGAWTFAAARFDLNPGFTGASDAPSLVVNARWNARTGELSSLTRGRPRGDCGTSEVWRWDGAMFRLVEARAMPVCRGAWVWPALWRAQISVAAPSP